MHEVMSEREMRRFLVLMFDKYHWDVFKHHQVTDMSTHYKINCETKDGDTYSVNFVDDTMWRMDRSEQMKFIIELGNKIVNYVESPQRWKEKHLDEIKQCGKEFQI